LESKIKSTVNRIRTGHIKVPNIDNKSQKCRLKLLVLNYLFQAYQIGIKPHKRQKMLCKTSTAKIIIVYRVTRRRFLDEKFSVLV